MFPTINNFVEPSAGCGTIRDVMVERERDVIAYDILPDEKDIIQANYLTTFVQQNYHITIDNPPFGYKGDLAIQFLNKALNESIAVAFIIPITAIKYSIQRQVNKYAKLIYQEILPIDSFELPDKTHYKCPSCFQIWTLQDTIQITKI